MSGHSKWSTIKRQKAVTDARRSAIFTKYARLISVAARLGGGDPNMNFRLRLAIDKAKSVNMPNDNIDRAIKSGTGEDRSNQTKEITYEGFGPGGTAVIVETITDNPNRTAADMRSIFNKYGGSLGGQNSVLWMFDRRGVVHIPNASLPEDKDAFFLSAVDAGASDVESDDEAATILSAPEDLPSLKSWLDGRSITNYEAGLELVSKNKVDLGPADQEKLYSMLEELDEHADVTNVVTNES